MHVYIKRQLPGWFCLVLLASLTAAMSGCRNTGQDVGSEQPILNQIDLISVDEVNDAEKFAQAVSQWRALIAEAKQDAEQQDWDGAIEKYTMALRYQWPVPVDKRTVGEQNAELFLLRGQAFLAKQMLQLAIEDFSDAIKFGDDDLKVNSYVERANARSKLKQWSQAAADCIRAIRMQPKNGQAFLVHSRALAEMGRLDQARIAMLEAEQLGIRTTWKIPIPDSMPNLLDQAQAALDLNQPLVAIETLEKAQLEGNDTWESNGLLARTLLQMNEHDRAIVASSNALRQNPQDADAYQIRGLARLQRESCDRAIADFVAAIALDASFTEPLQPYLTEARRRGGIHPEIRAQAIIRIKRLAAAQNDSASIQSESERWLLALLEMPNSSDQIDHFKSLMVDTPEARLESLNWLADFLMLDIRVPAVNAVRTWLTGKSPDVPPTASQLWERVASRKAAASHGVNLYPDLATYAIEYGFDDVLRVCIDLGICNFNVDHLYRAVARTDSRAVRMIVPYAVLADREIAGLLQYCIKNDKREDVLIIVSQHDRNLTFRIMEFLGLANQPART